MFTWLSTMATFIHLCKSQGQMATVTGALFNQVNTVLMYVRTKSLLMIQLYKFDFTIYIQ